MTGCSRWAFARFHDGVNNRARLGYVPGYRDVNSRVHIVLTNGSVVGRTLCNMGAKGTPFESAYMEDAALPCAHCFDRALTVAFRHERKAEEQPGRL